MRLNAQQIFLKFKLLNLTNNASHFSTYWLSRSPGYLATQIHRGMGLGPATIVGLRYNVFQMISDPNTEPSTKSALLEVDDCLVEQVRALASHASKSEEFI